MKIKTEHISGLECLSVKGNANKVAIILLHGYGANMHDLFPLWELWHQEGFDWYFPNGILSLPMGPYEGRSWFSIDVAALERAIQMGTHRDMGATVPPELNDTLKILGSFLFELRKSYSQIILGGFSQGAMCASHLAVSPEVSLAGLILLSGNLLAESRFPNFAKGVPFYQSHGTQDTILPLTGARQLEEKLKGMNFSGKLSVFQGGHEIPMSVINEVKHFLGTLPVD